jgi:ketosteroid isomerase-like protein
MNVETLKEAIVGLPEEDRQSFAAWINGLDYDAWDKEMAEDFSSGGSGAHLIEKVKREIADGKARPTSEGFSQHR